MKLACKECGRQIQVRTRDIRQVRVSVEPGSRPSILDRHGHLACPFCMLERGGFYFLEHVVAEPAGELVP